MFARPPSARTLLRPLLAQAQARLVQARGIHTVLPLKPELAEGAAPFLSKATVQVVAQDWQAGLLERLNDEVRNTDLETSSVASTVAQTRGDRYKTQTFNLASLALNNSFFFSNLRPEPRMPDEGSVPAENLHEAIVQAFGSVESLKKAVKAIADGMTSTGWIWVASDVGGNVGIIPSYGAGTVLSPFRMQAVSQPEAQEQEASTAEQDPLAESASPLRFKNLEKFTPFTFPPELGKHKHQRPITPLFVISLQEHAWALDYGVWGRDKYLDNFWRSLDWTEPSRAYLRVVRELLKV